MASAPELRAIELLHSSAPESKEELEMLMAKTCRSVKDQNLRMHSSTATSQANKRGTSASIVRPTTVRKPPPSAAQTGRAKVGGGAASVGGFGSAAGGSAAASASASGSTATKPPGGGGSARPVRGERGVGAAPHSRAPVDSRESPPLQAGAGATASKKAAGADGAGGVSKPKPSTSAAASVPNPKPKATAPRDAAPDRPNKRAKADPLQQQRAPKRPKAEPSAGKIDLSSAVEAAWAAAAAAAAKQADGTDRPATGASSDVDNAADGDDDGDGALRASGAKEVFMVEKLVKHRPKDGGIEYLVKWEGYDEVTWEPEENIGQKIVVQYKEDNDIPLSESNQEYLAEGEDEDELFCYVCKSFDSLEENPIVICDSCGRGYHVRCHVPEIPMEALENADEEWLCADCDESFVQAPKHTSGKAAVNSPEGKPTDIFEAASAEVEVDHTPRMAQRFNELAEKDRSAERRLQSLQQGGVHRKRKDYVKGMKSKIKKMQGRGRSSARRGRFN
mmetsp:Transcript_770/g.2232  ORF Transcript_770/g.2232 Transcript_770/m.2232 type:complete len:506 (-) Transcript_770:102-1619(-)